MKLKFIFFVIFIFSMVGARAMYIVADTCPAGYVEVGITADIACPAGYTEFGQSTDSASCPGGMAEIESVVETENCPSGQNEMTGVITGLTNDADTYTMTCTM